MIPDNNVSATLIAICGGSGSGKTTLVQKLINILDDATLIKIDDYYRDLGHLNPEDQKKVNFDHPEALELDLLKKHLGALKEGKGIEKPTYDFVTRTRPKTEHINPHKFVIVDGILALQDEELSNLYCHSIFLDVDADIRFIRRLKRDMKERGRNLDSVIEQYLSQVRPMYEEFVACEKKLATRVINVTDVTLEGLDQLASELKSTLEKGLN